MSLAVPRGARDRAARPPSRLAVVLAVVALLAAACSSGASPAGSGSGAAGVAGTITLYTSVTQNTVDAVVKGFTDAHPGVDVEVFRAPTAEVAARIATDIAGGGLKADVLWLTDPLSIAGYDDQKLLQAWTPPSTGAIPAAYRTGTFFGTRLLNMVMIKGAAVSPGPADWKDLLSADVKGAIALPDPGFAGSAFAALGYFSQTDGYGTAFFQGLKDNGATQLKAPDDVTTAVATGQDKVGITLDNSARTAITKGSPLAMVWPSSGAIAIYSPIAAVAASASQATADSFVDFTLSLPGQALIAGTGWQPVVGPGGPAPGGSQVSPDWTAAFGKQKDLLAAYRAIFGG
jgi:iron(III) transport system substrate-binding protein